MDLQGWSSTSPSAWENLKCFPTLKICKMETGLLSYKTATLNVKHSVDGLLKHIIIQFAKRK